MVTSEWVAVHRKHHAKCETEADPHSPQIWGIWRVLCGGVGLYRKATMDRETLEVYGRGTPDDWIERNLYSRYTVLGLGVLGVIDVVLFGLPGLAIYVAQLLWIPFWAAGVINGIGHYLGYRNFETQDASRNIIPLGVSDRRRRVAQQPPRLRYSAKLCNKWCEFDIGWMYIRILQTLGLAQVRRTASEPHFHRARPWPTRPRCKPSSRIATTCWPSICAP